MPSECQHEEKIDPRACSVAQNLTKGKQSSKTEDDAITCALIEGGWYVGRHGCVYCSFQTLTDDEEVRVDTHSMQLMWSVDLKI